MLKNLYEKFFDFLINNLPHPIIYYSFKYFRNKKFSSLQKLRKKEADLNEYSLKGYDELKCIFFHIPKNAGVSISVSLFGNLGGGHKAVTDYYLIYSPKEFKEYFKFTIVRNPWDRIVSAYFFLQSGGFGTEDEEWFKKNLSYYNNFEEFVERWINKQNIYMYLHFMPQFHFIAHRGILKVDKFYKLENLSSAIEDINAKLNVNISLNHKNKSTNRDSDYRSYYNDTTKRIIEDVYQKDIQLFNYSF